jgi:hypothetical protein
MEDLIQSELSGAGWIIAPKKHTAGSGQGRDEIEIEAPERWKAGSLALFAPC